MFRIIRKLGRLLDKKQKMKVVILFFLMLVSALLEVTSISLMIPILTTLMNQDIMLNNPLVGKICGVLSISDYRTFLISCIIFLIVVFVLKDVFIIFEYNCQHKFVNNTMYLTKAKLLHVIISRPYEDFLETDTAKIMRIISGDVNESFSLMTIMLSFWTETLISIALGIAIFIINPFMTLFIIIVMLITILIISKCVKPTLSEAGESMQVHNALSSKWLMQIVSGIKDIKISQKQDFFESEFNKSGYNLAQITRKRAVLGNVPRLIIEMTCICSSLSVVAFLVYKGSRMDTLVAMLGAFSMAALRLLPAMNRVSTAINSIAFQEPWLDELLDNISVIEKNDDYSKSGQDDNSNNLRFTNSIVFEDISYRYPNSSESVLSGANMRINFGQSIGIIGPSGSGKTTTVDILLGLLAPQSGKVLVDGKNIQDCYSDWLSNIGYIPQMIFMLDDTIKANVAFGVSERDQDEDTIWEALREAQLEEYVKSLPDGLNTNIGERGIRLSGGQRQRIGIARALYGNPTILVFDEATSALDNETEKAIMESIDALHGKKTLIIIAHRLTTIKNCDIVYKVDNGKILPKQLD